jgi:Tol biopolymer transport system component
MPLSSRSVHRRRRLVGATVMLASLLASVPTVGEPTSAQTGGLVGVGAGAGTEPSISGDGRWLVFERLAPDGRRTVVRHDNDTGAAAELSVVPDGVRAGDTVHPVISRDGCVVIVQTQMAFDVFRDDDARDRWDVYRHVVPECGGQPGSWELVSVDPATGTARDDVTIVDPPTVSGSGTVVAFGHPLDVGPDGVTTITVVDLTVPLGESGREATVAGMPVEAPTTVYRYRGAREPALSANGRHLAFTADVTASDVLPGWATGPTPGDYATSQVYVWDRGAGSRPDAVTLASGVRGTPSAGGAWSPAISESGRKVVFVSPDQGLVDASYPPCAGGCPTQVFVFDRDTDGDGQFGEPSRVPQLSLASSRPDPRLRSRVAGDRSSWAPAVNSDASQVVFVTDATNLATDRVPGGGDPDDGDLLVAETGLDRIDRLTAGARPTLPGVHAAPAVSDTGRVVAFDSAAGALLGRAPEEGRQILTVTRAPRLSIVDADFGTVLVGWLSAEIYVAVVNDGPGAFIPARVTSTSPNIRVTDGGTCRAGVVVPAGGTCRVYLTLNATAPQLFRGEVTVAESGFGAVSVTGEARGVGGEPVLQADPSGIDLDEAVVGGTPTVRALDITNVSFGPTSVAELRVVGVDAGDFAVSSQSCTNRALNPVARCAVEITFTPTRAGRRHAVLQATTTTGSYAAAVLSGVGRYEAAIGLDTEVVSAGGSVGVGGDGFPARTAVVIRLADSPTVIAIAETNEAGRFLASVEIPSTTRAGRHDLLAVVPDRVTVSSPLLVRGARSVVPGMPGYGLG